VPADTDLDLTERRRVHIVGVAGAGMSAIALVLARMGHAVSGSDIRRTEVFERLAAAGVTLHTGNDALFVPEDADAVVYSTAVPLANVELQVAAERGIPVLHRSAALAALAATRRTIAVAGSHGKTTTASMIALILRRAGWDPSFVIGGEVNEIGTNAAFGDGEWLVLEADESDGTFLQLRPDVALVTSVEPDHLGHYHGRFSELIAAFEQFVDEARGIVVCNSDDRIAATIAAARPNVRTYGTDPDAHYRIVEETLSAEGCRFAVTVDGQHRVDLAVPVGVKASANAAGAAAVALELGIDELAIAGALAGFGGVARRFQYRGTRDGIAFVDDYAHLPTEVAAAIDTARHGPWLRVVVVFQPHRYTRTASIGTQFADAFTAADALVLTDVFPASEPAIAGISGRIVLHAVLDAHPALPVAYLPGLNDLASVPARYARAGDVVLTLGAGDLTTMPDVWLAEADAVARERQP